MADEEKKDNRPWWKKKTNRGLLALGIGGVFAAIPGAPVLFTIGTVGITTGVIATIFNTAGAIIAGYGIGDRVGKKLTPEDYSLVELSGISGEFVFS